MIVDYNLATVTPFDKANPTGSPRTNMSLKGSPRLHEITSSMSLCISYLTVSPEMTEGDLRIHLFNGQLLLLVLHPVVVVARVAREACSSDLSILDDTYRFAR